MGSNERVKMIREDLVKTQKDMAEMVGVGLRTWQQYEEGVHDPSWKVVSQLAGLGYNTNWLATGNGLMKTGASQVVQINDPWYCSDNKEPDDGFVKIPRYKVDASAGGGSIIHSEQIVDFLTFRADWVRNALGVPASALALISVKGDSMEPTLSNGDVILIDMSATGIEDNSVYVLRYDGKLVVKRVQRKFDGSFAVTSDNNMYAPEFIKGDLVKDLQVVGRVVWCGRRM